MTVKLLLLIYSFVLVFHPDASRIKVAPNLVKKRKATAILGILCYVQCHHEDIGGNLLVACRCLPTNTPVG